MNIAMYEYIEVNLIGVALLLVILIYSGKKHETASDYGIKYFRNMLIQNIFVLLADNGIYLLRGHASARLAILDHVLCILFFVIHSWFCCSWLCYVLSRLYPGGAHCWVQRLLIVLPALVNSVIIVLSPLTGWIYTLSADNVYHRGPFLWVTEIDVALYYVVSIFFILREHLRPSRLHERNENIALLFFPIPSVIGNILQMRFYGFSIVWVCTALSMLILFMDRQSGRLSHDALTGLYNRAMSSALLERELRHTDPLGGKLWVAIADIDSFKQINDRFGHVEGDAALVRTARLLKKYSRSSDFISRYGGDEFLIIGHVEDEFEAGRAVERILEGFAGEGGGPSDGYSLRVSIGYTVCAPDADTSADQVINEADKKMYECKAEKAKQAACAPQ